MWLHYKEIIMFATTQCLNTTYFSFYDTRHCILKRQHNIKDFLYQTTSSPPWHQRWMKKLCYSWMKQIRALFSDCICSLPLEHSWSYTSLFLIYIISKQANPKYILIKWTKASVSHNKKGFKKIWVYIRLKQGINFSTPQQLSTPEDCHLSEQTVSVFKHILIEIYCFLSNTSDRALWKKS